MKEQVTTLNFIVLWWRDGEKIEMDVKQLRQHLLVTEIGTFDVPTLF